jgi:hypothetical protein
MSELVCKSKVCFIVCFVIQHLVKFYKQHHKSWVAKQLLAPSLWLRVWVCCFTLTGAESKNPESLLPFGGAFM